MDRVVQDDAHVFEWAFAEVERDAADLATLDEMTEAEWQAWVALPDAETEIFRDV